MLSHFHYMPVDRTTIRTRLRIHPDFFDDPNAYIRERGLEVRTTKPRRGNCKRGPTRNLTLDVLRYKGLKAELCKIDGDPLAEVTIRFNPGVCLYGHNGRTLSLSEFLDALALLVIHLRPLLLDPADWVDLVPGVRSGGVAYWHYVEVHLQCPDPDGTLLAAFRHVRHPEIRTPARHWPESVEFGPRGGQLQLAAYRKAVEMVAKEKLPEDRLSDYRHVLRLEARLKGKKLIQYLGNERNVEVIDGEERLVRFYPQDPVVGSRECFGAFEGVYASDEPLEALSPRAQLEPLGRLLALVALDPDTSQTFPELLAHLRFYTGASSDTIKGIRDAGLALLASRSSISKDDLFSDAAFHAQLGIASEGLEAKVCHEIEDTTVHRLIAAAYRPPDQPFQPLTQWPGYLRV